MENRKGIYRQLCEREKSICIYDQPWWLDIDCGAENWDVLLSREGDEIVGALPFYMKTKHGIRYITIPFRSQHHGPWIRYHEKMTDAKRISRDIDVMTDLIQQMEAVAKDRKIVFFNQCFSPNVTNWLPFYWSGYKQTTQYTYRIEDIRDPEEVLKHFEYGKRYNIRKAMRDGIVIKEDLPVEEFYALHKSAVEKKGKRIKYPIASLKKYYDGLYSHNSGKCLYAVSQEGTVEGALLAAYDASWGYNWITAFDPDAKASGASDLLVYSMIQYLSDKTIGFDFEGSMDRGIEHSYRHFGTKQTPYFRVTKCYVKNPLVRTVLEKKLAL